MKHIVLIFFMLAMLVACQQKQEQITLRAGFSHSATHSFSLALQRFGDSLENWSDGRFKVELYHSSQLGDEMVMQEMMTIGSLDMSVTGLINTYEPLFAVFELPYLYRDRDHIFKVYTGDVMANAAANLPEKGIRIVGFFENGFRHLTNSVRPIRTPVDVSGLQIRTPENIAYVETINAFGGIPTPLAFAELYTALVQGVVDGQENPLQNIYHGRLYEAQAYLSLTGHIYNSGYVVVSEKFWQRLTQDDQKLLQQALIQATLWQLDYVVHLDRELQEKIAQEGVEIVTPDRAAFEAKAQAAYESIYQRLGDPARKLVQKIKAVQ